MEADQMLNHIVDMGHGPPMPWALTHLAAEQGVYTCEPFPPSSDLLMHLEGTEEQYLNASRPDLVQACLGRCQHWPGPRLNESRPDRAEGVCTCTIDDKKR